MTFPVLCLHFGIPLSTPILHSSQPDAFSFNAISVAGGGSGSGSGGIACSIDVNGERIPLTANTAVSIEGDMVNTCVCIISVKLYVCF